jgi:hypothetical protein
MEVLYERGRLGRKSAIRNPKQKVAFEREKTNRPFGFGVLKLFGISILGFRILLTLAQEQSFPRGSDE